MYEKRFRRKDLNLLFDLRESWSVLTWARLRFMCDASSVELTVALAMITQKLIGLRCLKCLFLVGKQFLLHFLILDAALKLLKELIDLFSSLYNKETQSAINLSYLRLRVG